ncbi:hypothetical protein ACU4GD_16495 [Cupriavidus basilensis]
MADTSIKVDLAESPYENREGAQPLAPGHPRWPAWVRPGDDFILETYDWTGGFIKNNELRGRRARDIDLSIVHFLGAGRWAWMAPGPCDLLVGGPARRGRQGGEEPAGLQRFLLLEARAAVAS